MKTIATTYKKESIKQIDTSILRRLFFSKLFLTTLGYYQNGYDFIK